VFCDAYAELSMSTLLGVKNSRRSLRKWSRHVTSVVPGRGIAFVDPILDHNS
jgi:hypothetical protein